MRFEVCQTHLFAHRSRQLLENVRSRWRHSMFEWCGTRRRRSTQGRKSSSRNVRVVAKAVRSGECRRWREEKPARYHAVWKGTKFGPALSGPAAARMRPRTHERDDTKISRGTLAQAVVAGYPLERSPLCLPLELYSTCGTSCLLPLPTCSMVPFRIMCDAGQTLACSMFNIGCFESSQEDTFQYLFRTQNGRTRIPLFV